MYIKYYRTKNLKIELNDLTGFEPGLYGLLLVREDDKVWEWSTGEPFTIENGMRPDGSIGEIFTRPGIRLYLDSKIDDLEYIGGIYAQIMMHKVNSLSETDREKMRHIVSNLFEQYANQESK